MGDVSIVEIMYRALVTVITVSAPPLICGLVVGILVSVFQAVTSIQEATLAFVPKILAVMVALMLFGSFMGSTLKEFTISIFDAIPRVVSNTQ